MLKQVFLARFEPVVTCLSPWKIPQCLKRGQFWDHKRSKMGQNVFSAHFEPVVTCFAEVKVPKFLENGPFCNQKWVKNRSKMRFSQEWY